MTQRVVCRDPEVMGGAPVFCGTRVPVQTLLDHLAAGDTIDQFLEGFPSVTRQQSGDCLTWRGHWCGVWRDAMFRALCDRHRFAGDGARPVFHSPQTGDSHTWHGGSAVHGNKRSGRAM